MRISNKILLLPFMATLGACAYSVESSNQEITFLTPGAENARCEVYVDKIKYKVFPPQERNIKKSENDMHIICYAPGNRTIEMDVAPSFTKRAVWGGPVGVAWDYASKSLYYYPSVIAVDFSQETLVSNGLPSHNNRDIRQPEDYNLDEILPSEPRLNSDKYKVETPLLRRDDMPAVDGDDVVVPASNDVPVSSDKGDLQSVIENLTGGFDDAPVADDLTSDPVSLYPGQ